MHSIDPGMLSLFALISLLSLVGLVFWVWMLIDAVTNETNEGSSRLIWVLVIVLAGWIGAFIYLLARRPERIRKLGS
jgi:hypothetical protein